MTFDFAKARENMVEQQVRPWDVLDLRVLGVLATLPREDFVDAAYRELAYSDLQLPLGNGAHMMKPVLEGRVLQSLLPQPHEEVLEIGTGSGYLTACLARLARSVHSLEIDPALAEAARVRLANFTGVSIETADAMQWHREGLFDVVCVTGAVFEVPAHFMDWLRPGGRMFVIQGESPAMQATLLRKDVNGTAIDSLFETDLAYLVGAAPLPRFHL